MSIIATCPSCSRSFMAPTAMAGRLMSCPSCNKEMTVPTPDESLAALGSGYRLGAVETRRKRKQELDLEQVKPTAFRSARASQSAKPVKVISFRKTSADDEQQEQPAGWREWLARLLRRDPPGDEE